MGREVVPSLAVRVNEVEPHIFYSVLRRRRRIVRMNGDVVTAIDSQRVQSVEGTRIERRRTSCLRCCHRKLAPLIGCRPIGVGRGSWKSGQSFGFRPSLLLRGYLAYSEPTPYASEFLRDPNTWIKF